MSQQEQQKTPLESRVEELEEAKNGYAQRMLLWAGAGAVAATASVSSGIDAINTVIIQDRVDATSTSLVAFFAGVAVPALLAAKDYMGRGHVVRGEILRLESEQALAQLPQVAHE
jgi:hypothetical protein